MNGECRRPLRAVSRAGSKYVTSLHPEPAVQQPAERRIDSERRSDHQLPLPTMSDLCPRPTADLRAGSSAQSFWFLGILDTPPTLIPLLAERPFNSICLRSLDRWFGTPSP